MSRPASEDAFSAGLRLARAGKWVEAAAAYREAISANPENAEAFMNLGFVYYELGYDQEAQEAFARAEALRGSSQTCNPSEL